MNIKRNILCLMLAWVASVAAFADVVGSSTGFLISNDGKIVTDYALASNAKSLVVYGLEKSFSMAYKAKVVRVDLENDLAVIQVDKQLETLPYVVAPAATNQDSVSIVSYPLIIKFKTETYTTKSKIHMFGKMFMLDNSVEMGGEGSPVFNSKNELIGYVNKNNLGELNIMHTLNMLPELAAAKTSVGNISDAVCMVAAYDDDVEVQQSTFNTTSSLSSVSEKPLLDIDFDMVSVAGGKFMMGEKREVEATVDSFKIAKYEVTQAQWNEVMHSNPSPIKGDNLPVYNVSYNDVIAFIARLNELTGRKYRLPKEAEWEFAARGGVMSKDFQYAGSNDLDEVGWTRENANAKPHPVGTKKPNELGIYDMTGNVSEWCSDDFKYLEPQVKKDFYYANTDTFTLYKIEEGDKIKNKLIEGRKVMKGSGYFHEKARCGVAYRRACSPTDKYTFGFRLAE
ncbi:MAG: SUMF1/EgtB/PvdO family nonheme iron enzyme [Bacteroidales bacterium]|nr:SUMF1/EgtB/PvdO family nonheme iron enzyme [Candidatus Scybalocola fimicaballi]